MKNLDTLLLIDGSAIMYRAYFALPPLTTKQGLPTNAIYGFFMMISKMIEDFKPQYVVVCMDTPTRTFRKEMYQEYQSHRPDMENNFKVQIPVIRDLMDKGGILRLEKPGYEADDVIGTLATRYKKDHKVLILTGDKDIMQLVDDNVMLVAPKVGISNTVLYDRAAVLEKLGVQPEQIPDLKGLIGDPSDNYPGAKGIGPKTAAKLIAEYGSVDGILKSIDTMPEGKTKTLLQQYKNDIEVSHKLATIVTDLELDKGIEDAKFAGYQPAMKDELQRLQMNMLLNKLFPGSKTEAVKDTPQAPKEDKKETSSNDDDQQSMF